MNTPQTLGSSRALGSFTGQHTAATRAHPTYRRYSCPCVGSATAVPLPTVKEDQVSNFSYDKVKAFTSGVGFVAGDVLAQQITGSPNLDVFRSVQLGAIGAGLDIFRQDLAGNAGGHTERIAQAAKSVSSQAVWAPLVACTFYAALKVVEGRPEEILQGVEDKMTALVVGNYFLWPLTRYLNDTFVPAEHRVTANHIITVVWNAWLSTLGHAPQLDPTDLLHKMGGESAVNQLLEHVAPALTHMGETVSNAASPFVHQAAVGVAALADRMPSCLLEKAFSKSLDVLSPFSGVERSPSQLLEAATSISLDRTGTLELVLDRLHSARL